MHHDFHRRAYFGLTAAHIVAAAFLLTEGGLTHGGCALVVALIYAALFLYG